MEFIQNLPFISIILCLVSGSFCIIVSVKTAKWINLGVMIIVTILSILVFGYTIEHGSFVYMMGHQPAPFGNEIRAGILESLTATFFCIIMILSICGGRKKLCGEVEESKQGYYYILVNLLLSSLLALIYTNDLFTAYVFIEINTISACGLIMIRQNGRTIEAAVRYMIMSLLGSGLLLLGIAMLYDITGHLLMSNVSIEVQNVIVDGVYTFPLLVTITLVSVGLAIKSALFPFHAWLPDAYGYSTVSSAAILSSLVSKGYIFILFKIIYRVIGFNTFRDSQIINALFVFGLMGMIVGSLSAIRENDIRRMISFSSVAQIGYIYMGIGLGTKEGMIAAVFHVFSHAATKSLLFIAAIGLTDVSKGSRQFMELTGAGYRHKIAGVTFTVGSLSMVGVPIFVGFISKMLFAQGAVTSEGKVLPTLITLALSAILNAIYFMKTVIRIYTPVSEVGETITFRKEKLYGITCVLFILVNIGLGIMSQPIVDLIEKGLEMFS